MFKYLVYVDGASPEECIDLPRAKEVVERYIKHEDVFPDQIGIYKLELIPEVKNIKYQKQSD
jgi:hypothetical protein